MANKLNKTYFCEDALKKVIRNLALTCNRVYNSPDMPDIILSFIYRWVTHPTEASPETHQTETMKHTVYLPVWNGQRPSVSCNT